MRGTNDGFSAHIWLEEDIESRQGLLSLLEGICLV